ncbi:Alg9-like mannosyltransferase family-domain-containing protein [Gongronella butleri]|nr:Alg9-like mannosyltransferase family-domain-containing protein [Gongronella butleri]
MGKTFRILYGALLCFRYLMAMLPGYIHPDEFFQSPEVMANAVLKVQTFVPWEYHTDNAARSVLIPFLTTGLPFWVMKQYGQWMGTFGDVFPSTTILKVERVSFFALSTIVDYCVYRLCRKMEKDELLPVLLVATSQVTLVYCVRPFSNAIESCLLCLSLLGLVSFDLDGTSGFTLGAILVAGIFNRITFPLFGIPIGIGFLYIAARQGRFFSSSTAFLLGAGLAAGVFVVTDSLYFGGLTLSWADGTPITAVTQLWADGHALSALRANWTSVVLTPLNNLHYNLDASNLAEHGLHPHYLHLLVNLPMLYGPLAFMALWAIYAASKFIRRDRFAYLFYVLVSIVVVSMVGLSAMPHQEARFLVPLLVPLILLYTWDQSISIGSIYFLLLWVAFNFVFSVVMGNMHQGGVVPSMEAVQRQTMRIDGCELLATGDLTCTLGDLASEPRTNGYRLKTHVVYYKTYMPPRHLLSQPHSWAGGDNQVEITDVAGSEDKLLAALTPRLGTHYRRHTSGKLEIEFTPSEDEPGTYERTLLICPGIAKLKDLSGRKYMLLAAYQPHINFDDFGDMFSAASNSNSLDRAATINVFSLIRE